MSNIEKKLPKVESENLELFDAVCQEWEFEQKKENEELVKRIKTISSDVQIKNLTKKELEYLLFEVSLLGKEIGIRSERQLMLKLMEAVQEEENKNII